MNVVDQIATLAAPVRPCRVHCQVIGCRRTAPLDGTDTQIICGKCWRTIPLWMRRRYRKMRKAFDALDAEIVAASPAIDATGLCPMGIAIAMRRAHRIFKLVDGYWPRLIAAANDAKVGIR